MYQLYGQLEFSLVFNRTLLRRGGKTHQITMEIQEKNHAEVERKKSP